MRIYDLIVEPGREDHIARHHVTVMEAEEVAFGHHRAFRSRDGYYGLIGQTEAGRYLTVIVAPRGHGVFGLVTARDSDQSERRLYERHRQG